MSSTGIKPENTSLEIYGIKDANERWNLSSEELTNITVEKKMGTVANSGALAVNTGKFTGRSPEDRFIVFDDITRDSVWWGNINKKFDADKFDKLYEKITAYLGGKEVFVRDVYACADDRYKIGLRVINELPWSNMFVDNMFIAPEAEELKSFSPEWHVINAPGFLADPDTDGTRQDNFAILNFTRKAIIVGGTGYTGEIKKGMFSALNFILPHFKETLSMHCSANVGDDGDTALFFGLSGTGKTTLSADPKRKLIGDDEHGWTADNTIFNFEGGCYAKVIDLSEEKEPDIFRAIKPGAILENVVFKENGDVDFHDATITENTRVSYPIEHIENIQVPSNGKNPKEYLLPHL